MSNENKRKTWKHPWSYREGTIVTAAILLAGFGIQVASGETVLVLEGFPWNLISGIAFLAIVVFSFFFWKKHPVIKGLGSVKAALPAILGFTFLVLLMGFVKQDVPPQNAITRLFGLTHLVKSWPFILINLYLMILLGVITLKRMTPFNLKNAGFFVNHFGLFLVLFSTALGSSDMQRLTMNCIEGKAESNAVDESGGVMELPISIELLNFNIDEFRPKIALVDNQTGQIVEDKSKAQLELLDRDSLPIGNYKVRLVQFLNGSVKTNAGYIESNEAGSATSAKLEVKNLNDKSEISGWVSCGSYVQPSEVFRLDENFSLVMLAPEPRKFSSELKIQTKSSRNVKTVIEVNRPFSIDGWEIYQLSYNTEMGRWSNLSVLQLVRDPWLPLVYLGILLMMVGAAFLFVTGKPKNGGTDHVA